MRKPPFGLRTLSTLYPRKPVSIERELLPPPSALDYWRVAVTLYLLLGQVPVASVKFQVSTPSIRFAPVATRTCVGEYYGSNYSEARISRVGRKESGPPRVLRTAHQLPLNSNGI